VRRSFRRGETQQEPWLADGRAGLRLLLITRTVRGTCVTRCLVRKQVSKIWTAC
jgi:hypothetical protein